MDIEGQKFIRGVQIANGRLVMSTQAPDLDIATQPHTGLCYWSEDDGWLEIGLANGVTADATVTEDDAKMLVTDPFGLVHLADGDTATQEQIADSDGERPETALRCIRKVGDTVFAAGVDRAVYARTAGKWRNITTDILMDADGPVAIQGIDGFHQNDVYTAGWDGELWHFDGTTWTQLQSPTNIILNDIAAGPDMCLAVGLAGQIVSGKGENWEMIEQTETEDDFWSVRYFDGAFYLASLSGVFQLKDGELTLFRHIDADMRTAFTLTVGPSGLWSIGPQDIALFDGITWRTIAQS